MRSKLIMENKELSVADIMELFSVGKATAYRMAKVKGWDFIAKPLDKGGRQKLYLVPSHDLPMQFELSPVDDLPDAVKAGVVAYDETIPNLTTEVIISEIELRRAQLKADLCEKISSEIEAVGTKKRAFENILEVYNSGYLSPELFHLEGTRSMRTLRNWFQIYDESGKDFKSLVRLSNASSNMKATQTEQNFLLGLVLDANKIKIGSAIRKLKQLSRLQVIESPTSDRALRRWLENWRDTNIQQWTILRRGTKYSRDNCIISLIREECLNVGDIWVADGHKLAFDIIEPVSGKPKRMMLILFFDWGSRYPVRASIADTEDSEHILLALRNGIIQWGGKPKFVYLDNGKAFKSKLFHDKWEEHDLQKEQCGIFPRLSIEVSFAKAYNARAKVVERFFKTFQEDFERYMDTFRGADIADKPAFLMLKVETRTIKANGVRLANIIYYHDLLVNHVGEKVLLRYDLMDMRSILVYDMNDKLICQALARKSTHPFVKLATDKPMASKVLKKQLAYQRKMESDVKKKSAILRKQIDEAVSELPLPVIALEQSAFNKAPMIAHQETEIPFNEIEQLAIQTAEIVVPKTENEDEIIMKKLDKLFENIGL
ncbi:MAG: Mu transposase C-terminal domain-containing protein [Candidatus Cloacimonetes bacterium]|nr:Mu transposase C-terminal domain-containing protein [Candidatus Cloacimonadota bacterium]